MNDPRGLDRGEATFRPADAAALRERFARVRALTLELAAPLSAEDACAQSMPDASPVKWHLAHTTWFFETFVLETFERGFRPFLAAFRVLFNSYYNGVGEKHPRPRRGMLTRPALADVLRYRQDVEARVLAAFDAHGGNAGFRALVELGLHHEQQHQELILTDVKHLLAQNPLHPAYLPAVHAPSAAAPALDWTGFEGGIVEIGHAGEGFSFDNELPRHRQYVQPYSLASRVVTNGEYAEFIEDGGYREAQLWLSEGWDWVQANALAHPLYWQGEKGEWREFTLRGLQALDPARPATHLSYFEAEAYARWAGARLPTEAEWEHAAAARPVQGNFLATDRLHPQRAQGNGLAQMFGDVWEWTQSSYAPYPGFRPAAGAIGEYNGKFMVNQYVLRGGSCATPEGHVRASYRNFFPAGARWQFSGLRLAR
ncbi:MAG TPA: ergothioneine biosynthesis protein EgtB [Burkholderiales bacterium]|nr:ergothioneine biosynthesis protein EgtB [Burkholderiales bacterium]